MTKSTPAYTVDMERARWCVKSPTNLWCSSSRRGRMTNLLFARSCPQIWFCWNYFIFQCDFSLLYWNSPWQINWILVCSSIVFKHLSLLAIFIDAPEKFDEKLVLGFETLVLKQFKAACQIGSFHWLSSMVFNSQGPSGRTVEWFPHKNSDNISKWYNAILYHVMSGIAWRGHAISICLLPMLFHKLLVEFDIEWYTTATDKRMSSLPNWNSKSNTEMWIRSELQISACPMDSVHLPEADCFIFARLVDSWLLDDVTIIFL